MTDREMKLNKSSYRIFSRTRYTIMIMYSFYSV